MSFAFKYYVRNDKKIATPNKANQLFNEEYYVKKQYHKS